jgi:glycosyltransferase involved in cell wall biosynthesis
VASNLSLHLSPALNKHFVVMEGDDRDYPHGGELHDLDSKAVDYPWGKFLNLLSRARKLRAFKKQHAIDTTISFLESGNFVNLLARADDRIIVSVRNFLSKEFRGFYGFAFKTMIRLFYNRADVIVVVSRLAQRDMIRTFKVKPEKVRVIYNPYDLERIDRLAQEPLEPVHAPWFEHPVVITVGRLREQKGQWHLIRAFRSVKQQVADAKLVIVGRGPLQPYLEQLVRDCGIADHVLFSGFQENPFRYVRRAAVFALPSLYEGFPNALAEAMACGTPVVSADCRSGPREILAPATDVDEEATEIEHAPNGVLVPTCDGVQHDAGVPLTREEEMLAEAVCRMLVDQKLRERYSAAARLRSGDFHVDHIIREWESII